MGGILAAILAQQLPMNVQTLAPLRENGLGPETVVQLDFFFVAPSCERAVAFKSHLEVNDCLEVETHRCRGLFSKRFDVTGKSRPTTVDAEILNSGYSGWSCRAFSSIASSMVGVPNSKRDHHVTNRRIELMCRRSSDSGSAARTIHVFNVRCTDVTYWPTTDIGGPGSPEAAASARVEAQELSEPARVRGAHR